VYTFLGNTDVHGFVQVIREELLPEKYIEAKKSIRGDPTKAESLWIYLVVM